MKAIHLTRNNTDSQTNLLFCGTARSTRPAAGNLVIIEQLHSNDTALSTLHVSEVKSITRNEQIWHGHVGLHSQGEYRSSDYLIRISFSK